MLLPFFYISATGWVRGLCAIALLLLCVLRFGCPQAWAQARSLPGSGNSLFFNGIDSYVDCGPTNRAIRDQLVLTVWVKTQNSGYQCVVSKFSDGPAEDKGFFLYTSGGKAGFSGRNGSGRLMSSGLSTSRIDDGRWHHLAGICSGNPWRWQIVVDGILENTGNYSNAGTLELASTAPLLIGCDYVANGHYFEGEIDELKIASAPSNDYSIRLSMCSKYTTAPQTMWFNYRFDMSAGTTLVDNGSRPADGTLHNFGNNPWRTSGAPIGDRTLAVYGDLLAPLPLNQPWRMETAEGDSIIIDNISPSTRGIHIYLVDEPPSILPSGPSGGAYFGVFTVGDPSANSYTLSIRPAGGAGCRNAYTRLSNDRQWSLPAQLPSSRDRLLIPTTVYRSEHILTRGPETLATISGDSVACAGGRATLAVAGAGITGIRWNTGATTPTLSAGPGAYTAVVTFASGCSRVLQHIVRSITPGLIITGDSTLCPGRATSLTALAARATSYRWSTGATTATVQLTQSGTYTVTATYPGGCTVSARRTVRLNTELVPTFTLGVDTTLCEGEQVLLQGPAGASYRYQWSDGSTNRQLLAQAAGRYTLRVSTACGEQSASRTVAVASCLKVPNIITANGDKHNDRFTVQGLKGEGWVLDVYNRWGRAVFQTANYHNEWGADAAPGVYYVLLRRPATGFVYKGWLEVVR
ncbi:LamG-like jellyroll fold domain-containing protein [Hymenobacter monticola]|uniref:Gliding motility-associated C-terminal domain-containing protein n=1 Tax=Hymenobacter monticola TaxID=1705399 RepID=A0ABY4B6N8_9BACT|nr:LamG-like jellyroll fold domain-containing protein [Hymenobacter monticola]UOE33433.1 gliding motility-associated C-terminal domain-containing protein [Hymenobacter monticola]